MNANAVADRIKQKDAANFMVMCCELRNFKADISVIPLIRSKKLIM
jgi:hypothetical protein